MTIELSGVRHGYNGRTLLDGIDVALDPGSFHFLTGASGSGKTALLKLCHLELRPDACSLRVLGADVRTMSRDTVARLRRRIGVLHQDCRFLDHLPVEEDIALPLRVAGAATQASAADIDEPITWAGLRECRHALPPEPSGGERQRATLARAVVASPDLVPADEPTGNIGWEMALRLLRLIGFVAAALIAAFPAAMVTLAAQAALAANARVVEALHLVGARDVTIARAFTRRFTLRTLAGAVAGTAAGLASVALLDRDGVQGVLLTGLGFERMEWLWTLAIPLLAGVTAFWATRGAALRALRRLT